ncbi:MAG: DUF4377 domain-containing protein [Staphylococcus sp.]|nr:DUF4377 domain-containing protein [Staphylococcus sp.]
MNKLIIPFIFIACLFVAACSDDEPKDKTKDIIMSVSEEPGIMYGFERDPMPCLRVMDEDFPGEWRNLSMTAIEGFEYQVGHMYTLRVRRTILANPPADASAYTYKLLSILEDRVWPPVDEPEEEITVNREEDIPYEEKCPYHIYDLYRNGDFVVDNNGKFGYKGYAKYDYMGYDDIVIRLEYAIPKESPDFLEFNRIGKMAYFAYVISPLTDRIEKVRLDRGRLFLKEVISKDLFDKIVAEYESGTFLEYGLILANIHGYGLQKVKFSITKE